MGIGPWQEREDWPEEVSWIKHEKELKNVFWPYKKFRPNFFSFLLFSTKIYFDPNFVLTKFWIGFWDFGFGIQNLEFRIWVLGSVTWNPVFWIEDLGLRIWDLDSS